MSYVISRYTMLVEAYNEDEDDLFYEDYDIGTTLCTVQGELVESTINYDEPNLSHLAPCEMRWAVVCTETEEIEITNPSLADFQIGCYETIHKATGAEYEMEPCDEESCAFYMAVGDFDTAALDTTRPSFYSRREEFELG